MKLPDRASDTRGPVLFVVLAVGLLLAVPLALREPTTVFVPIGVVVLGLVVVKRPQVLAYATIVLAFTSFPSAVPQVFQAGGTSVLIYEPTLLLGAAWALWLRPPMRCLAPAFLLAGLAAWLTVLGLSHEATRAEVVTDARGLFDVAAGCLVGSAVMIRGHVPGALRTVKLVLWVSAVLTLGASLNILDLQGTAASATLDGDGSPVDSAVRLLTPDTFLGVVVLAGALALYLTGRARTRQLLALVLPAFVVVALAFSRNNLLGLGVAAIAAIVLNRSVTGVLAAALRVLAATAVVAMAVIMISALPSSVYLQEQVSGFQHRVVDGFGSKTRAHDPSTQYRLAEDRALKPEIGQAPLIGHGFGIPYKLPQGDAGTFQATNGIYYAHEYYLWLLFKGGLLGLAVFTAALLPPILRVLRRPSPSGVALGAVVCGLLAISVVAPVPNDVPGAVLFGGVLGALAAVRGVASSRREGTLPAGGFALSEGSRRRVMASTGAGR